MNSFKPMSLSVSVLHIYCMDRHFHQMALQGQDNLEYVYL